MAQCCLGATKPLRTHFTHKIFGATELYPQPNYIQTYSNAFFRTKYIAVQYRAKHYNMLSRAKNRKWNAKELACLFVDVYP